MKMKVDRKEFLKAVEGARRATVVKKYGVAVLGSVKLEVREEGGVTVTGFDHAAGIELRVSAVDVEPGAICIPAALMVETVKSMKAAMLELWIERTEGEKLWLAGGPVRLAFDGIPADVFPSAAFDEESEPAFTVDAARLMDAIKRTAFATNPDDIRTFMNGILFRINEAEFTAVATDGHRLSLLKTNSTAGQFDGILNAGSIRRIVPIIPKTGRIAAYWVQEKKNLRLEWPNGSAWLRLIDVEYPKYERVIPDPNDAEVAVMFDRKALLDSIGQVYPFSRNMENRDMFMLRYNPNGNGDGSFTAHASTTDAGGVSITIPVVGQTKRTLKEFEVGLNGRYVADILKSIPTDTVGLEMKADGLTPLTFIDPAMQHRVVLMPVKV